MSVFTHVLVGTNDLEKARAFYDRVLGALELKRLYDGAARSMYGATTPQFGVTSPLDGASATHANGGTISFRAQSPAAVDAFHAEALAMGGMSEGAPGPRPLGPNVYGAYVRDLEGNKLAAFSMGG